MSGNEAEQFHQALLGGGTAEPAEKSPDAGTGHPKPEPPKKSLEDLLADLDDDRRGIILGEVNKARSEAKGLRERLRESDPKVAEYDRLVEASRTDAERAQEALKAAETRATTATQRIARAEVKAALTGLVDNPDAIVEDLNMSRFVDQDGEVDTAAVSALKAKYAAFAGRRPPRPDPSQASGANRSTTTPNPAAEFAAILQGQLKGKSGP